MSAADGNAPDLRHVRRAFGRAARGYDAAAVLQREVRGRRLERLDYLDPGEVRCVLDVGSGPGSALPALHRRFGRARVVALDMALPMLAEARRHGRLLRPVPAVCADAAALPLADGSVDLVFSNLCVQWTTALPLVFAELRRVLRPGGLLLLSTFGPATLAELREAFAAVDGHSHVSRFPPMQAVGDALMAAGLRDPVLEQDLFTLTYPDLPALMRELRAIGATHAGQDRRRTLTGPGRLRRVAANYEALRREGVLPSSWEVIYAHAFGPLPGQPLRAAGIEEARFPADRIPIRRRPR